MEARRESLAQMARFYWAGIRRSPRAVGALIWTTEAARGVMVYLITCLGLPAAVASIEGATVGLWLLSALVVLGCVAGIYDESKARVSASHAETDGLRDLVEGQAGVIRATRKREQEAVNQLREATDGVRHSADELESVGAFLWDRTLSAADILIVHGGDFAANISEEQMFHTVVADCDGPPYDEETITAWKKLFGALVVARVLESTPIEGSEFVFGITEHGRDVRRELNRRASRTSSRPRT